MGDKADYVCSQSQTRDHECHWPGCTTQVKPALWGCRKHWYTLPEELQKKIWKAFEPGQEISGRPSQAYVDAANEVQIWIADYIAKNAPKQGSLF